MGLDYALVHLCYTIPPAVLLTWAYRPLFTSIDAYKLAFLILVAVSATIPWDSYLIRNRVWSYPKDAVLGPTLLDIPAEELFFFVIQTYNTSFLYFILSKPTFHVVYLRGEEEDRHLRPTKRIGAAVLVGAMALMATASRLDSHALYMHLIFIWAGPFLLMLWLLSYQFLISLPWTNTALPILLPTLYLWIVDTLSLKRGTWVIEDGTKLGMHLWDGLDIEEATFFLVTNALIVFGLVAFDNALAVLEVVPRLSEAGSETPSPAVLVRALLSSPNKYDTKRIRVLQDALARLRRKSRSFYIASGTFDPSLRRDLILLYSFCRSADDLIDDAPNKEIGKQRLAAQRALLRRYFDTTDSSADRVQDSKNGDSTDELQNALNLLPAESMNRQALDELLNGFETDLTFGGKNSTLPIQSIDDLNLYASRVAGTVAEMCIDLIYHHSQDPTEAALRKELTDAGKLMAIALQYVNIARDIRVDAVMKRVYIPTEWLQEEGFTPKEIIHNPDHPGVEALRQKLLDQAFALYRKSRPLIEALPQNARGPVRVMCESYMEIGRTLRRPHYRVQDGKATVSTPRRIWVAWKALTA